MVTIKVTRGCCGVKYTNDSGSVRYESKTAADGAFEIEEAQAKRLVSLGVAEYVAEYQYDDQQKADESQETEKAVGHLDAEQLSKMDYNELKKLAADMGVKPKGKTKADYIAAIEAVEVDLDEDDGDEPPVLSAADPE